MYARVLLRDRQTFYHTVESVQLFWNAWQKVRPVQKPHHGKFHTQINFHVPEATLNTATEWKPNAFTKYETSAYKYELNICIAMLNTKTEVTN